jgi:hypothetical protein
MHAQLPKPLRTIALTLSALAAWSAAVAAEPVVIAKAHTPSASPLARVSAPAPMLAAYYAARAEAEIVGMVDANFEAVLVEALGTPTAAGSVRLAQRGAVEEVIARSMGGPMP